MIFGQTKLEMKVGMFVFISLIILAMFVLMIGNIKTWSSGYLIRLQFNFVNGVKVGAPVRFAGVDVGEVKRVVVYSALMERPKVEITAWLQRNIRVPVDSTVWVNTLGLLGEKYIEIMPGKNYVQVLKENEILVGVDPISMQEVGDKLMGIVNNVSDVVAGLTQKRGTVGKLLFDDALYNELMDAVRNKQGTVGRLFYDDALYKEAEALLVDIKAHPWKLFYKEKK